jgi:hypothetical protein
MDIEQFRSAGALPTGPVSAWPFERNKEILDAEQKKQGRKDVQHATKVKASWTQMGKSLAQNAAMAFTKQNVESLVREARMETCRQCPSFIVDSQRCAECGCFMAAKTWLNGDPKALCPLQKWEK